MRTGLYIVKTQSPCCGSAHELWTVRAKSVPEARKRILAANGGRTIYEVRSISGNAWRHYIAPLGVK